MSGFLGPTTSACDVSPAFQVCFICELVRARISISKQMH